MKKKIFPSVMLSMAIASGMANPTQVLQDQDKNVSTNDSVPYITMPETSPKLMTGDGNPLLDFTFTADPTAVEYEGRLYVYATNDQQQYEAVGGYDKNSYEHIKSLVVMSTDDMVNWDVPRTDSYRRHRALDKSVVGTLYRKT